MGDKNKGEQLISSVLSTKIAVAAMQMTMFQLVQC